MRDGCRDGNDAGIGRLDDDLQVDVDIRMEWWRQGERGDGIADVLLGATGHGDRAGAGIETDGSSAEFGSRRRNAGRNSADGDACDGFRAVGVDHRADVDVGAKVHGGVFIRRARAGNRGKIVDRRNDDLNRRGVGCLVEVCLFGCDRGDRHVERAVVVRRRVVEDARDVGRRNGICLGAVEFEDERELRSACVFELGIGIDVADLESEDFRAVGVDEGAIETDQCDALVFVSRVVAAGDGGKVGNGDDIDNIGMHDRCCVVEAGHARVGVRTRSS